MMLKISEPRSLQEVSSCTATKALIVDRIKRRGKNTTLDTEVFSFLFLNEF